VGRHLTDQEIEALAETPPEAASAPEFERAVEHIGQCPDCAEELALARTLCDALDSVPRLEAPAMLFEGVMSSLANARARERRAIALVTSMLVTLALGVVAWLVGGGAGAIVLESLEIARSTSIALGVLSTITAAFPAFIAGASALILILCSYSLARLVKVAPGQPIAQEARS